MKLFCIALLTLACFISCNKSDSPTPPAPPAATDTTTLVKFVTIDSTQTAPFDTASICKFDYDNAKRVTKISILAYNTVSRLLQTVVTLTYSYAGTDTLPYRYFEYNRPLNSTFTLDWNHELSYDAQGRMVRDSSNEVASAYTNVYTDKYIYTATQFTDSAFSYLPTTSASGRKTFLTKDGSNNIIKQVPENSTTATEIVYDNHLNPLYKTSVGYPYLMNSTYLCFFSGVNITVQKNNFTKVSTNTYDAAGTTILNSYNKNFNITYKANGQPSVIRIATTPTPVASDKYKYLFYYGI